MLGTHGQLQRRAAVQLASMVVSRTSSRSRSHQFTPALVASITSAGNDTDARWVRRISYAALQADPWIVSISVTRLREVTMNDPLPRPDS